MTCARHCSEHVTCINLFNSLNNKVYFVIKRLLFVSLLTDGETEARG